EPRRRLTRDPNDYGQVVANLNAVRLVQTASGEANEPLDLAAVDGPHDRVDDRPRSCRHQPCPELEFTCHASNSRAAAADDARLWQEADSARRSRRCGAAGGGDGDREPGEVQLTVGALSALPGRSSARAVTVLRELANRPRLSNDRRIDSTSAGHRQ